MRGLATDEAMIDDILKMAAGGLGAAAIHDETGVPIPTVYRILRDNTVRHRNGVELTPEEQLGAIEMAESTPYQDVIRRYDIEMSTLYTLLRQAGIDVRETRRAVGRATRQQRLDNACAMYEKGFTVFDILIECELSSTTLYKELRKRQIPRRVHALEVAR
jgi:hypothetical protein